MLLFDVFAYSFSNIFNNYSTDKLTINSESRSNVGGWNVERLKLLLQLNRTNFNDSGGIVDRSFIAFDQTTKQLRETFCPGQQQKQRSLHKRSIKSLESFGLLPKDKTALRNCTTNKGQLCLALKDDKPPST